MTERRQTPGVAIRLLAAAIVAVAIALLLRGVGARDRNARNTGSSAGDARLPKVALIIDDFGYVDESSVRGFLSLGVPITVAVLPYQRFSAYSADAAHRAGMDVLLHLPMEGGAGSNPGPDALLSTLTERELRARARSALGAVPHIIGANNHMGSAITADSARMRWILEELAREPRIFVDSRTTNRSVGESLARRLGIPSASRNVFLDNDKTPAAIARQWERGLRLAERSGSAIVIGHVYPETLAALRDLVARTRGRVEFVGVSALVH